MKFRAGAERARQGRNSRVPGASSCCCEVTEAGGGRKSLGYLEVMEGTGQESCEAGKSQRGKS